MYDKFDPNFISIRRPGFEVLPVEEYYRNTCLYSPSDIQWKSDPFEIILPGSHTRYHSVENFKDIQVSTVITLCSLNLYRIMLFTFPADLAIE